MRKRLGPVTGGLPGAPGDDGTWIRAPVPLPESQQRREIGL
jgi:hypothetical protein